MLDLVQAAYAPEPNAGRWLSLLAEAARTHLDRGEGLVAFSFDASATTSVSVGEPVFAGAEPSVWHGMLAATETLSPLAIRHTYLGARPFGSVSQRFERGTREIYLDLASRCYRPNGYQDLLVLHVVNANRKGVVLAAPTRREYAVSRKELASWGRVAAHVRAGYDLHQRASLSEGASERGAEAVFSPSGELRHAQGRARTADAREALRRAVLEIERAKLRVSRSSPGGGSGLWPELVAGRWTLVDHFDSDGRRYLVAHRNDAATARMARLTPREREVIQATLRGQSNKVIAYELSIGESSVSEHLSIALCKLGLRSTAELLRASLLFDD